MNKALLVVCYLVIASVFVAILSGCVALVPFIEPDSQAVYTKTCDECKALQVNQINFYQKKSSREQARVEKLINQLQNGSTVNRAHAAFWLGELKAEAISAVPALIASLTDKSYWVRRASAKALGKIGDVRAKKPLLIASRDRDRYVAEAARRALKNCS